MNLRAFAALMYAVHAAPALAQSNIEVLAVRAMAYVGGDRMIHGEEFVVTPVDGLPFVGSASATALPTATEGGGTIGVDYQFLRIVNNIDMFASWEGTRGPDPQGSTSGTAYQLVYTGIVLSTPVSIEYEIKNEMQASGSDDCVGGASIEAGVGSFACFTALEAVETEPWLRRPAGGFCGTNVMSWAGFEFRDASDGPLTFETDHPFVVFEQNGDNPGELPPGTYTIFAITAGGNACGTINEGYSHISIRPVAAACPADIADDFGFAGPDGQVGFGDFLFALTVLGPCPGSTPGCDFDIADDFGFEGADGQVSFGDFLYALTILGPCP